MAETESAPPNILTDMIAGLIADHAPTDETVTVNFSRGREAVFQILSDEARYLELKREGVEWIKMHQGLVRDKKVIGPWIDVATDDAELLGKVFILSRLAVTPDFKNELSLLTLARKCRPVFDAMHDRVLLAAYRYPTDDETVDEEGKG